MKWKDVAGIVGSAAPLLGGLLGGPAGAAVGSIVASALGTDSTPDAVHTALRNDPEAIVKLRTAEMAHEAELRSMVLKSEASKLESVNATMRAEATSGDPFVSRWRPVFGYVMALTWAAQMFAIAYTIVTDPLSAPHVISAMASLGTIWSVGLAVVGVSVWSRSKDKATIAGSNPIAGFAAIKGLFNK